VIGERSENRSDIVAVVEATKFDGNAKIVSIFLKKPPHDGLLS
jgi:hypothetical protein